MTGSPSTDPVRPDALAPDTGPPSDPGFAVFWTWFQEIWDVDWRNAARVVADAIDSLPVGTTFVAGTRATSHYTKRDQNWLQCETTTIRVLKSGPRRGRAVTETSTSLTGGGWSLGLGVAFGRREKIDWRLLELVYRTSVAEQLLPDDVTARIESAYAQPN